jgi:hypothetical protein
MREEIEAYGKPAATENFDYVANQVSSELELDNGIRDKGRAGRTIDDWVEDPRAQKCGIKKAEMAALRLYTTAAYQDINAPLRDQKRYFLYIFFIYFYHLHLAMAVAWPEVVRNLKKDCE